MKKFFIILLTFVMVFAGTVNAAETLQSKIDSGETDIVLDADYTEDITIPSGKTVSIDLNGHIITSKAKNTITVELGATLTVKGTGEIVNDNSYAAIFNNGTTVIEGGTIRKTSKAYYNIANHGQMTINGGKVVNAVAYDGSSHASLVENGYYNYTSTDSFYGYVDGVNQAKPTLTINGGEFDGGLNTIKNDDGAVLTIKNGTFKNNIQVAVFNVSEATINGGIFEVPLGNDKTTVFNRSYNDSTNKGVLIVNGGTFNADYFIETLGNPGTVTVTAGTFNTTQAIVNMKKDDGSDRPDVNLSISGGEFATDVEDKYQANDVEVVEEDGTYYVGKPYGITVDVKGKGDVVFSKTTAVEGQTVTFTVTAKTGYKFKSASVKFGDGESTTVTNNEFVMKAGAAVVTVEFEVLKVDETPKTGSVDVMSPVCVVAILVSLAGIAAVKKYTK